MSTKPGAARDRVSQAVRQGRAAANDAAVPWLPAGQIGGLVMAQLRAQLREPKNVVGTSQAARAQAPDLTKATMREAP